MRITARDIAVRLGGARILDGVDFDAAPGTVVGLIGPNGAGKTTLLRVLARLRRPDGGVLRYDDRPAVDMPAADLARAVAFLAQGGAVHWPMKVGEIVALGRLPHRRGRVHDSAADRAAVARALAAADVSHLAGRAADTLSGGERTRVLIARALAVEAPMLLADEPTAALDPAHQIQVMELLRATARGGAGVVVVLHDLTLAARFCDRLVLLAGGRVAAAGAPCDVLAPPTLAAAYGIEALAGRHAGEPFVVPWRRIADATDPNRSPR